MNREERERLYKTLAMEAIVKIYAMILKNPDQPIENCRDLIFPILEKYKALIDSEE